MTPDQMLSLGRALLADGRRGFRRIVPQRIWRSFRSQTAPSLYYRSGFWFNVNRTLTHAREINPESAILESIPVVEWSKACLSRSAPCDLMAMVGSQGQRIYIVPSERLVIVRTGVGRKFDDREFLQKLRPLFRPG
jgi:CubicO group peptidase (beta-lactamase class C family)